MTAQRQRVRRRQFQFGLCEIAFLLHVQQPKTVTEIKQTVFVTDNFFLRVGYLLACEF